MAVIAQRDAQHPGDGIEVGGIGMRVRLSEVQMMHVVDRHYVEMGVGHLETGDHQADPCG